MCPGLGEKKIKRLHNIFTAHFLPQRYKKQSKLSLLTDDNDSNDDNKNSGEVGNESITFGLRKKQKVEVVL